MDHKNLEKFINIKYGPKTTTALIKTGGTDWQYEEIMVCFSNTDHISFIHKPC